MVKMERRRIPRRRSSYPVVLLVTRVLDSLSAALFISFPLFTMVVGEVTGVESRSWPLQAQADLQSRVG